MHRIVSSAMATVAFALSIATLGSRIAAAPPTQDTPARQVLFLHTEFFPYQPTDTSSLSHRLGRELCRQALLISAREEFGIATRDEALGESLPEVDSVVHLLLTERMTPEGKLQIKLSHSERGEVADVNSTIWEKTYDFDPGVINIYSSLVPQLEADSRGAMIDALKAAGFRDERNERGSEKSSLSTETEAYLNQVDFVPQFIAVRSAHGKCDAEGESPAWQGVLVRGYANLAVLTQHHWNTASEVFTARAWLYAQRMSVSDSASANARWHQAYGWALGGAIHLARNQLNELTGGDGTTGADGTGKYDSSDIETRADWTKLLTHHCNCDREGVKATSRGNDAIRPLATLLWYRLTSDYRYSAWMYDAGLEAAKTCPAAYGVYADLAQNGQGLAVVRSGARWAPMALGKFLPASLTNVPDLPPEVAALLGKNATEQAVINLLVLDPNASDEFSALPACLASALHDASEHETNGEPSWSALGNLLNEEQFIQAANYMDVATNATESPLAPTVDAILPLIKQHRYAAFVDSFRFTSKQVGERNAVLRQLDIRDPRRNMWPMMKRAWYTSRDNKQHVGHDAYMAASPNFTAPGLIEQLYKVGNDFGVPLDRTADAYATIAPQSAVALRLKIRQSGRVSTEQLQEWESEIRDDADAFSYLGNKYWGKRDEAGAVRCYEKSLAILPNHTATQSLSNIYYGRGDIDKWEETLANALKARNLGLDHSYIQNRLATTFVNRGEWSRARPYAEAAAQTWSYRAMESASHCCEGLALWTESERWISELSKSYPSGGGTEWYRWCCRTGRGDKEAALEMAEKYYASEIEYPNRDNQVNLGVYLLLRGDASGALKAYEIALSKKPTCTCACMVAHLSRKLGDEKTRAKVIESQISHTKKQIAANSTVPVQSAALALLELLQDGDTSDARIKMVDKLLCKIDGPTRCAFAFFLAQELDALGQTELAEVYWRKSLVIPRYDPNYATLSGMELAARHGVSRPDNDALSDEDLWPRRNETGDSKSQAKAEAAEVPAEK